MRRNFLFAANNCEQSTSILCKKFVLFEIQANTDS